MSVPEWIQDSIFYQIFPDRFSNGDPGNDPSNVQQWGVKPTTWGLQGGDLLGVVQRLDYLVDLGVNAIYLNPIFYAASNHRYDVFDYYRIDPKLGSTDDFRTLLKAAHERDIRIILDGVFNHCGRGFFAFLDLMENQEHSPYLDWYHVKRFPLEAYKPGEARNYLAWWKIKSLPKFNTNNPEVREYLLAVARYWVEQGIDGWRLDVPNEIDDDGFWGEFRHVVKSANPQAYLLGEIWKVDPRWVGNGHFDGLMHYPLRSAILELLEGDSPEPENFVNEVQAILASYPQENTFAQFLLAGSHDTPRIKTLLKRDPRKVKLLYLILFSYPGAPAIYYGDEIGLEGGKDPDCRRAFPWDDGQWDHELRAYLKRLIRIRREQSTLRRGELQFISGVGQNVVAMMRKHAGNGILVVFNASDSTVSCQVTVSELGWPASGEAEDLVTSEKYDLAAGVLPFQLSPYQGVLLTSQNR